MMMMQNPRSVTKSKPCSFVLFLYLLNISRPMHPPPSSRRTREMNDEDELRDGAFIDCPKELLRIRRFEGPSFVGTTFFPAGAGALAAALLTATFVCPYRKHDDRHTE